eukprot:Nitzschia sp. Nitz4//scaffold283_size24287//3404//6138//NITZ4_008401-RA/size24287-augustus-gene-0.28-mRNA-1//1//CDS//3329545642//4170//frame0
MAGPWQPPPDSNNMLVEVSSSYVPFALNLQDKSAISKSPGANEAPISRESVLQRLSEALSRRSLAKIDLSQRGLQSSDARLVRLALSQNANLTVLKLGYNNLGDFGVATIATGIAAHSSLILLDLGFNNFGDEGAKALSAAMRHAAKTNSGGTVRTLYLAGNSIGEDGALAIADFIRQGSRLRKLYLTGNRIRSGGVRAIAEAILEDESRRLGEPQPEDDDNEYLYEPTDEKKLSSACTKFDGMQELFLGGCGPSTIGCQAVARLLGGTQCLRVLSLPDCLLGDDDVSLIAANMKINSDRLPLESIQLSFNNITHKGIELLMNALSGSNTLKELKLDNNQMGDSGAHHLASMLSTMKSLVVLDVGFNRIRDNGLMVLMNAVAECDHVQSLSVSGNQVDQESARAVGYALAYSRSLQAINLVRCNINSDGQRHITAGAASNSVSQLRSLTGFDMGPCLVNLGFPEAMGDWTNEQVMNFIRLMYEHHNKEGSDDVDSGSNWKRPTTPVEPAIVVDLAATTYGNLIANGVDVGRRKQRDDGLPFESPLAGEAIIESSVPNFAPSSPRSETEGDADIHGSHHERLSLRQSQSFVVAPQLNKLGVDQEVETPDSVRKQRIVEWLCVNSRHLNELAQLPFSSHELWKLHQHYFTPVVNETGGSVLPSGNLVISSVPEVSGAHRFPGSASSSVASHTIPVSDTALTGSQTPTMLKRKVSYRFLSDSLVAAPISAPKLESRSMFSHRERSVARIIEDGPTGHSLPPKTKKARRNRTRISFVPRIKAKLDSYLDMCHEKALVTMRQLYFVEQAILEGKVHDLEPSTSPRTHLSGLLASEAEMIIVDMI